MEKSETQPTTSSETATQIEKMIENLMDDLRQVGPEKPLGYLPIDALTDICGVNPTSIEEELQKKGLKTLKLNREESRVGDHGALYAYDEEALQQLLINNQNILNKEGWPIDNESFIRNLIVTARPKTDLFNLIADAFNDKYNPHRKGFRP